MPTREPFRRAVASFEHETRSIAEQLARSGDVPSGLRARLERAVNDFLAAALELERAHRDDPDAVRRAQAAFRDRAAPLIEQTWLVDRSVRKPRGYAGDHAMLDAIYLGRTAARGIGAALDQMVLDCAAGRAVVARKRFVLSWLAERLAREPRAKIVDLACGPCRLEKDLLDSGVGGQARFVALDSDEEALRYAATVLGPYADRVELHRENAVRIARDRRPSPLVAGASYVVSLGLFDYLPRNVAVGLLRALRTSMRPGGELLVGNFALENPSRAFMEWLGDWPLIHRSEEELLDLFRAAGFLDPDLRLEREAEDGIVLLVTAHARQDRAADLMPANGAPEEAAA